MSTILGVDVDWEGRVRDLWSLVDAIDELGFSFDPRDWVDNLWALRDLVDRAWDLVTALPPGDPDEIDRISYLWNDLKSALDGVGADLVTQRTTVDVIWVGTAADLCRRSIRTMGNSVDDAVELAADAYRALASYSGEVAAAHLDHGGVADGVRAAAGTIGPCWPWEVPGRIRDFVSSLGDAVRAAIAAYTRALDAAALCSRVLDKVSDMMPFPVSGGPGLSAVESINLHTAGKEKRPLVGDVAERARSTYDDMNGADRLRIDQLLAGAPSAEHRAWITAVLASGADVDTIERFGNHIAAIEPDSLASVLDPTDPKVIGRTLTDANGKVRSMLRQQSDTTCGSASLIVARMLADPVYALRILDGYDASTDIDDGAGSSTAEVSGRFADEEGVVKARTNSVVDSSGGLTMPWPPGLGTPPWGASDEMNNGAGVPGVGYNVRLVDSDSTKDAQHAYDALSRAADAGTPAPLYIGDAAAPQHVVLVVGREGDSLTIYDPGTGRMVSVSQTDFVAGTFEVAGWDRAWATVAP